MGQGIEVIVAQLCFFSDSDSDSLFSNPKYIHNLLYIYINICINTGYNYFMYILWLPRGHIALGCLPVTPLMLLFKIVLHCVMYFRDNLIFLSCESPPISDHITFSPFCI